MSLRRGADTAARNLGRQVAFVINQQKKAVTHVGGGSHAKATGGSSGTAPKRPAMSQAVVGGGAGAAASATRTRHTAQSPSQVQRFSTQVKPPSIANDGQGGARSSNSGSNAFIPLLSLGAAVAALTYYVIHDDSRQLLLTHEAVPSHLSPHAEPSPGDVKSDDGLGSTEIETSSCSSSDSLPPSPHITAEIIQLVDARLRKYEQSHAVQKGLVSAYDVNCLGSNQPMEDMHTRVKHKDSMMFGVFDGHSGYECSSLISRHLPSYVAQELDQIKEDFGTSFVASRISSIKSSLISAFNKLDFDLINLAHVAMSQPGYNEDQVDTAIRSAMSGSCAILSLLDEDDLFVANTGDSRAVLGHFNPETDEYEPVQMSTDQTASEPTEYQRLVNEHPGEESTVVVRNRVLGSLMPTRAFGDARYKWDAKFQEKVSLRSMKGDASENRKARKRKKRKSVPKNYRTPPYVTSEPDVMHRKLEENDHFLVLATDGLWDVMSNEEVVHLVGESIRHQELVEAPLDTQVECPPTPVSTSSNHSSLSADSTTAASASSPWVFRDSNCSTHLIRNALGADYDKVSTMLNHHPSVVRQYRDDMTVIVIFFEQAKWRKSRTGMKMCLRWSPIVSEGCGTTPDMRRSDRDPLSAAAGNPEQTSGLLSPLLQESTSSTLPTAQYALIHPPSIPPSPIVKQPFLEADLELAKLDLRRLNTPYLVE